MSLHTLELHIPCFFPHRQQTRTHIRQQNSCSEQRPMRPIPGGQERWEQNPRRRSQSWVDAPTGGSPAGHGDSRISAEMLSTAAGPCAASVSPALLVPCRRCGAGGCRRNPGDFVALGWDTATTPLSRLWERSPSCLLPLAKGELKDGSRISLPPPPPPPLQQCC